jgi:hypothetical protein
MYMLRTREALAVFPPVGRMAPIGERRHGSAVAPCAARAIAGWRPVTIEWE